MCDIVNFKFLNNLELKGENYVADWLMENELIPNKVNCPKCGKLMKLIFKKNIHDGYVWRCCSKEDHENCIQGSVRKNSLFSNSRMSLSLILQLTYLWVQNCGTDLILDELHVSKGTACDWKMFCREICLEICNKENKLGGLGVIIEFIETEFENSKSCGIKKSKCICGGVERGTNKLFFKVVPSAEQDILLNLIQDNVLPGSIIISDCWQKYNYFRNSSKGFQLNESFVLQNPKTNVDTETVNGIWDIIKNQVQDNVNSMKHLNLYLSEYVWKKYHEEDADGIFISFLKATSEVCKS